MRGRIVYGGLSLLGQDELRRPPTLSMYVPLHEVDYVVAKSGRHVRPTLNLAM